VANKGDFGATLKQLGSKESIRSLATAMVTAGLMQGLTNADILPKGSFADLNAADALQKFAVQTTVRTAINAGINGQDIGEAAKQSLTATATDMLGSYVFDAIGDLGVANSEIMGDGSILKASAHAVAGGFLARLNGQEFTAGAISAAATELMSGALAEVDPSLRTHMAGMIGATAVMLTGGSAEDMQIGQTIAQSVMLNNHLMHPDFKKRMDDKFEEEKEEYPELTQDKLAKLQEACGKSHCFNSFLERWFGTGSISESDLKAYANKNGLGEFSNEEIKAFAELHDTTADAYRDEVALANRTNNDIDITNTDGTYNETKEIPLYVPDDDDRLAAIDILRSRSALPDDIHTQLDEDQWKQIDAEIASKRQSDPAYDAAMDFIETEGNDMLLAMALSGAGEFGAELALAKLFTAVKAAQTAKIAKEASAGVPGRVKSRINIANGTTRFTPITENGKVANAGWDHVVPRHFGDRNNQSQFSLPQEEIKTLLQSDMVVQSPIVKTVEINDIPTYVREVDTGKIIGTIRKSQGGDNTTRIYIQTDMAGNLITAYPIK